MKHPTPSTVSAYRAERAIQETFRSPRPLGVLGKAIRKLRLGRALAFPLSILVLQMSLALIFAAPTLAAEPRTPVEAGDEWHLTRRINTDRGQAGRAPLAVATAWPGTGSQPLGADGMFRILVPRSQSGLGCQCGESVLVEYRGERGTCVLCRGSAPGPNEFPRS